MTVQRTTRTEIARRLLRGLLLGTVLGIAPAAVQAAGSAPDVKDIIAQEQLREAPVAQRSVPGWAAPKKIIVLVDKPERLAWFQEVVKGPLLIAVKSEAEATAAMTANPDADAVVGVQCGDASRPYPPAVEMLRTAAASKSVRWLQISVAGVEGCAAVQDVRDAKILVTNMQGAQGPIIAEQAMALLLYLTRNMDQVRAQQQDALWKAPGNLQELNTKTMLILGLGGNGLEIAQRAHAFGMKIVATRNTGRDHPDYVSYVGGPDETVKLAAQADVIVSTLPLTPQTTHIFDASFFAKLKPTAYFINIGRGESVVTADLAAALEQRKIAGAGLDVTDPQPLPKNDPLWRAPNLILSPHIATVSDLANERKQVLLREQMRRYVAGEKMLMVVDLKRGY